MMVRYIQWWFLTYNDGSLHTMINDALDPNGLQDTHKSIMCVCMYMCDGHTHKSIMCVCMYMCDGSILHLPLLTLIDSSFTINTMMHPLHVPCHTLMTRYMYRVTH